MVPHCNLDLEQNILMRSDQNSQVGMVTLSGNCSAQWAWHDLKGLSAVTTTEMGKNAYCRSVSSPWSLPCLGKRGFTQSPSPPLSPGGLALPDCVFWAFVLQNR